MVTHLTHRRVKSILATWFLLLLAACGSANLPYTSVDDIARDAGMAPLATTPLPEGKQEIRLWLSTGIVLPNQMLRLTYAHERWLGELWRYWPRGEAEHGIDGWSHESFDQTMERCGCVRTIRGPENVVCRVAEEKAIDWESVALRLKQLDIAGLPEEAAHANADGDVLDVEVRAGAAYHRVRYSHFNSSESARRAGRVVQMMKDLDSTVRCDH